MNHRAKRFEKICGYYAKPGTDWARAFLPVYLSCGCNGDMMDFFDMAAFIATCRDLNLLLVTNPISWIYQPTCKQTADASCKASVDDFAKLWIKVPKDGNDFCADLYKGSQIMARSCN